MSDLFLKYMSGRLIAEYEKDRIQNQKREQGPVITISRDTGCSGYTISKLLYEQIQNSFYKDKQNPGPWKLVDKEVLHIAAQTLNVNPYEINYVFEDVEKKAFSEVLESLSSKYYHSDRKVKRIIVNVIRGMAERGHVIFLGRGSVAITRDMKNSLHVRLVAPLDWRIKQVANHLNIPIDQAAKKVKESDERRTKLIECFDGKFDYTLFDVSYNTATLSHQEIVDQIFDLATHKGFFK
jgi:cytidylate kinase